MTVFFLALLALLRAAAAAHFYMSNLGIAMMFHDDANNIIQSLRWAAHPCFWPDHSVLPLGFWSLGLGFLFSKNVFIVPITTNTLLCIAVMFAAFRLTRTLFPDDDQAPIFAAALAGLHPAFLVQGMGALVEFSLLNLFALAGCESFIRFNDRNRTRDLFISAACFAAASMTRYDGWFLCAIFSCLLGAQVIGRLRAGKAIPWTFLAAFALVWAHSCAWAFHDGREPLQLFAAERRVHSPQQFASLSGCGPDWSTLLLPFRELFFHFPFFPTLPLLLWISKPRGASRQETTLPREDYLAFPLGQFFCLAPFYAFSFLSAGCHYTHLTAAGLLFIPWSAHAASRLLDGRARGLRPLPLCAALCACSSLMLLGFPRAVRHVGHFHQETLRMCAFLRGLKEDPLLRPTPRMFIQLHPNEASGSLYESFAAFLLDPFEIPSGEDIAQGTGLLTFDRLWRPSKQGVPSAWDDRTNPSILSKPPQDVAAFMKKNSIAVAVLLSHNAALRMPPWMPLVAASGGCYLCVRKDDPILRQAALRAARPLIQDRRLLLYRSRRGRLGGARPPADFL
ncbi:MAG: glycosyltransferase family 39 protein [Elusimicrobiota bacterium]